jgi:Ca2+-dependent lipid-binding protein
MKIQKTTMQQKLVSDLFFDTFRKITLSVSSYFPGHNDLIQAYNFFAINPFQFWVNLSCKKYNRRL